MKYHVELLLSNGRIISVCVESDSKNAIFKHYKDCIAYGNYVEVVDKSTHHYIKSDEIISIAVTEGDK
jgi:hypothetical protein